MRCHRVIRESDALSADLAAVRLMVIHMGGRGMAKSTADVLFREALEARTKSKGPSGPQDLRVQLAQQQWARHVRHDKAHQACKEWVGRLPCASSLP